MKTSQKSDTTSVGLPFIKFAEDNEYRFYQDFRFWKNVPSNVNFYPIEESKNGLITFVGDGYGIQELHRVKFGISGEYGNGSISLYSSNIPHLLDWCRANFLNKH